MNRILLSVVCAIGLLFTAGPAEAAKTLRMAGMFAPDHFMTKMQREFAKNVEERTNGELKIRVYPANQLGDYVQVYEELRRNTLDLALVTVPSQFDPRLEATYMHYMATNFDEAKKIYGAGSPLYKLMEELHDALGVKFLGFSVEGFGGYGVSKLPDNLETPGAPKNILLRSAPMAVFQVPVQDQGYSHVASPFAELHTTLQTRVVDGWTGATPITAYTMFRDVFKYWIKANTFFENISYMMSKDTFEKLTPEQQQILVEEGIKISAKSMELAEQEELEALKKMEEFGIKVIYLSDEQLKAFADFCREKSWPRLEERLTKPVIDMLRAAVQ